jgi:hypothetical protein
MVYRDKLVGVFVRFRAPLQPRCPWLKACERDQTNINASGQTCGCQALACDNPSWSRPYSLNAA